MQSPEIEGDQYYTRDLTETKLGLKFNDVEVTVVFEGGWAAKNGVEVDDEIYKVAGRDFRTMTKEEKVAALLETPRPVAIVFKRPVYKDTYFEVTFTERKVGMTMKGKHVKTVESNGYSEKHGVQVGDEIAEIAGEAYSSLADADKWKIFQGQRPLIVKFVRRVQLTPEQIAAEKAKQASEAEMTDGVPQAKSVPQTYTEEDLMAKAAENQIRNSNQGPKTSKKSGITSFFGCCEISDRTGAEVQTIG